MTYTDTHLYIDGKWKPAFQGGMIPVINPATGEQIGAVSAASQQDLDQALEAARQGFARWRDSGAMERSEVLRRVASALRTRVEEMAAILTLEQGKPLAESRTEILLSADIFDWFAEEARRLYGRIIPSRDSTVQQHALRRPIGPVAAFTPWNFPISQAARKIGAAIAVGCSLIVKPPEDAPAAVGQLAELFTQCGLPPGVLNFVYGDPPKISSYLIASPVIRKVSFTGSITVGKLLAAQSAQYMKPCTMELGGHAPVIITESADVEVAAMILCKSKFRNAGQVCVSPTRFIVHERIHDRFVALFVDQTAKIRLGPGMNEESTMGPLISSRRVEAVESLITDALSLGAGLVIGGKRRDGKGSYFEPTVLTGVTPTMRIMNEEPFGPVAAIMRYRELDEAIAESNRLAYGLASYAFSRCAKEIAALEQRLEVGMLTINHLGLGMPETPFGGVKDSGYGSEGGTEALEGYLTTMFITKSMA